MASTEQTDPVSKKQPRLDLEFIITNYQGRTRFERLFLIGINSPVLGIEALKAAVHDAKNGKDVQRYLDAQGQLELIGPNEYEAQKDVTWTTQMNKINKSETQRLESELQQYKNNLIKESIRMGNEDLGNHYQAMGDLSKALDAFGRMRQEANMPKHVIDLSRHLIEVSIEQKNWISVISNIQRIKQVVTSSEDDKELQPYLCAVEGIANLDSGKYSSAAACFLSAEPGMGQNFNTVVISNDIAIYGGLCALATLDRLDLESRVLKNTNFRTYLELEPQIRRAITFFINGRYSDCLGVLEAYHTDYSLDIYLKNHINEIYQLIRRKSIIQYFIPFSCVAIDSIKKIFALPGQNIEEELVSMIECKDLDARIDTQNQVLVSVPSTLRHSLQRSILKTAKSYEYEACMRIQHINILSARLDVNNRYLGQDMMDVRYDIVDNLEQL